ncbi:cilia- and flagella-associated protein 418 isoform X2 [Carassius carassius]|uniref:cilia- and flagella-associated protein 418 isoform X2 n=1 Tax=Carassius carassius TaxID=217509 RepID=UPI0028689051|nr:cilia- and flagella-associated protein 418 isoform X2 [Carassius carassius]
MADDLDDLLDEVESKFCCSTSASKQSTCALKQKDQKCANPEEKKQSRKQGYKKARHDNDDIDAMLQEILDDDYQPTSTHESVAAKTSRSDACSQTASKKCCPVFLGGSSVPHGIGTSVSQRACNGLRCTSCDFSVIMFEDQEWDSSCDYLFFRNNMPDHHKLKVKLRRKKDGRAYACQCSWHSAVSLSDLREQQQLKIFL